MKSVVFVHAHPDDEALLSGGTLRALHQKGFRTVVVFLTNGERGQSKEHEGDTLGRVRQSEALRSATILGVSKTYFLQHHDSGLEPNNERVAQSMIPINEASNQIREILEVENPEVLIGYDAQGGYGHPDHKAVHQIVRQLAELIETPNVLEVTVDRSVIATTLERFRHLISLLEKFKVVQARNIYALADGFSATADISYSVDIRRFVAAKQSALKAHYSQSVGGIRNLRIMTLLPLFAFKRFFGKEWFVVVRESSENPFKSLIS